MGFFIYKTVKYHKLSEIQFNEMHKEFAVFLATQNITKKDWTIIKYGKPELLDNYLNSFSDLVWDKILSDCEYLEYSTSDQLYLFHTKKRLIDVLIFKIDSNLADLNTSNGFKKILNLIQSDQIDIFKSSKAYTPSRNMFIYEYLKKGAMISKGKRYEILKSYFPNSSK